MSAGDYSVTGDAHGVYDTGDPVISQGFVTEKIAAAQTPSENDTTNKVPSLVDLDKDIPVGMRKGSQPYIWKPVRARVSYFEKCNVPDAEEASKLLNSPNDLDEIEPDSADYQILRNTTEEDTDVRTAQSATTCTEDQEQEIQVISAPPPLPDFVAPVIPAESRTQTYRDSEALCVETDDVIGIKPCVAPSDGDAVEPSNTVNSLGPCDSIEIVCCIEPSESIEMLCCVEQSEVVEVASQEPSELVKIVSFMEPSKVVETVPSLDEPPHVVEIGSSIEPSEVVETVPSLDEPPHVVEIGSSIEPSEVVETVPSLVEPPHVVEIGSSKEPSEVVETVPSLDELPHVVEIGSSKEPSEVVETVPSLDQLHVVEIGSSKEPSEVVETVPSLDEPPNVVEIGSSKEPSEVVEIVPSHEPSHVVETVPSQEPSEGVETVPFQEPSEVVEIGSSQEPPEIAEALPSREPSEVGLTVPSHETSEMVEIVPSHKPLEVVEIAPFQEPSEVVEIVPSKEPSEVVEIMPSQEPSEVAEIATSQEPSEVVEMVSSQEPSEVVESMEPSNAIRIEVCAELSEDAEIMPGMEQCASIETACLKPSGIIETAASLEPSGSVEPSESIEILCCGEPSDCIEIVPSMDPSEAVEVMPFMEPSEMVEVSPFMEPSDLVEIVASIESSDSIEVVCCNESSEVVAIMPNMEPCDKTEAVVALVPSDAIQTAPSVSVDSSEAIDNASCIEPSEFIGAAPSIEPSDSTECLVISRKSSTIMEHGLRKYPSMVDQNQDSNQSHPLDLFQLNQALDLLSGTIEKQESGSESLSSIPESELRMTQSIEVLEASGVNEFQVPALTNIPISEQHEFGEQLDSPGETVADATLVSSMVTPSVETLVAEQSEDIKSSASTIEDNAAQNISEIEAVSEKCASLTPDFDQYVGDPLTPKARVIAMMCYKLEVLKERVPFRWSHPDPRYGVDISIPTQKEYFVETTEEMERILKGAGHHIVCCSCFSFKTFRNFPGPYLFPHWSAELVQAFPEVVFVRVDADGPIVKDNLQWHVEEGSHSFSYPTMLFYQYESVFKAIVDECQEYYFGFYEDERKWCSKLIQLYSKACNSKNLKYNPLRICRTFDILRDEHVPTASSPAAKQLLIQMKNSIQVLKTGRVPEPSPEPEPSVYFMEDETELTKRIAGVGSKLLVCYYSTAYPDQDSEFLGALIQLAKENRDVEFLYTYRHVWDFEHDTLYMYKNEKLVHHEEFMQGSCEDQLDFKNKLEDRIQRFNRMDKDEEELTVSDFQALKWFEC